MMVMKLTRLTCNHTLINWMTKTFWSNLPKFYLFSKSSITAHYFFFNLVNLYKTNSQLKMMTFHTMILNIYLLIILSCKDIWSQIMWIRILSRFLGDKKTLPPSINFSKKVGITLRSNRKFGKKFGVTKKYPNLD